VGFFRRFAEGPGQSTRVAGLAEAASSWGWEPAGEADRQRLAASPTPLSKFADVRTPDEAIARMMSLPDLERVQLLAMFQKADVG